MIAETSLSLALVERSSWKDNVMVLYVEVKEAGMMSRARVAVEAYHSYCQICFMHRSRLSEMACWGKGSGRRKADETEPIVRSV